MIHFELELIIAGGETVVKQANLAAQCEMTIYLEINSSSHCKGKRIGRSKRIA